MVVLIVYFMLLFLKFIYENMYVVVLVQYPGVTMPQPKGDQVFFVVHQRQEDPTELVAHLVKQEGMEDLKAYMIESG